LSLINRILIKVLNLLVPYTLYCDDGSRVDYLSRNDTLRYISPLGFVIQIPLMYDKETKEQLIKMPVLAKWENPSYKSISTEEMTAMINSIKQFVEKYGKPFVLEATSS